LQAHQVLFRTDHKVHDHEYCCRNASYAFSAALTMLIELFAQWC